MAATEISYRVLDRRPDQFPGTELLNVEWTWEDDHGQPVTLIDTFRVARGATAAEIEEECAERARTFVVPHNVRPRQARELTSAERAVLGRRRTLRVEDGT